MKIWHLVVLAVVAVYLGFFRPALKDWDRAEEQCEKQGKDAHYNETNKEFYCQ